MDSSNGSPPTTPNFEQRAPQRAISAGARSVDESCQWFHGKITRQQAEEILRQNGGRDGQFVVRESSSSHGDFAISVVHEGSVVHYQVRRHGEDAFFSAGDNGSIIHGLEELIRHYEQPNQVGLVCPLREMCKGQPPPHEARRHGRTNLLHRATTQCEIELVKELLRTDYSIDAKDQNGQTALHLACLSGEPKIVFELLEHGASTNCLDGQGYTPLHYACREGYLKCVQHLLDHGASTTLPSLGSRWAPLHFAAYRGDAEIMRLLLKYGAPIRPRTTNEELPQDLVNYGRPELKPELTKILFERRNLSHRCYHREDWFHGKLSRDEANALLENRPDGFFMLRTSNRAGFPQNTVVLSMVYNGYVKHFTVSRKENFYFIDDGPLLESLEALIEHYSHNEDGLPCLLRLPVKPVLSPVKSPGSFGWRQPSLPSPTGLTPNSHRIGQLENASIISVEQLKLDKKKLEVVNSVTFSKELGILATAAHRSP